jgi:hypothetical protein
MIKIENATVAIDEAEQLGKMKTLTLTIGDFVWNVKVPRDEFNEATCNCLRGEFAELQEMVETVVR